MSEPGSVSRSERTDHQAGGWSADALTRATSVLDGKPSTEARAVMTSTRGRALVMLGVVVAFALVLVPVSIIFIPPADLALSSGRRVLGHLVDAVAAVLVLAGIVMLVRAESGTVKTANPAAALTRPEGAQVDAAISGRQTVPPTWRAVVDEVARRRASDVGGSVLVPAGFAVLMIGRTLGDAGPFYQVAGAVLAVVAVVVLVIRGRRWLRARQFLAARS